MGVASPRRATRTALPRAAVATVPPRTGRPGPATTPGIPVYVAVDVAAVSVAVVVAHLLRFGVSWEAVPGSGIPYVVIAVVAVPVWLGVLAVAGCYDEKVLGTGAGEYHRVLDGGVHFLAVVALLHLLGGLVIARGFVGVLIPVAVVLTLVVRWRLRFWLNAERRAGRYVRRLLLVGTPSTAVDVGEHLARSESGFRLVGVCADTDAHAVAIAGRPVPVVGRPDAVPAAIRARGADAVALTDESSPADLQAMAEVIDQPGVELLVAPAIAEVAGPRTVLRPAAGLALLHVEEPAFTGPRRVAKEMVDRIGATLGLLALALLLAVLAVAIKLDSPGPVFFRQVRVGRDGRRFEMVKFRTMVVDAEALLTSLEQRNEADGLLFKVRDDPRVTRVGRVLRRYSLDEIPQLWNVVRGEMSLVGPRPPLPSEVDQYQGHVNRRLLVKPGMTGLWQVSGRSDLSWDEAIRLDLHYVDHWSPTMDFMIVCKTFSAVLRASGAY